MEHFGATRSIGFLTLIARPGVLADFLYEMLSLGPARDGSVIKINKT